MIVVQSDIQLVICEKKGQLLSLLVEVRFSWCKVGYMFLRPLCWLEISPKNCQSNVRLSVVFHIFIASFHILDVRFSDSDVWRGQTVVEALTLVEIPQV